VVDSLAVLHSRPLRLVDGRLQGAGADWLLAEAAGAQFVGVGEEHNKKEIPELTTALFRALAERHGFGFLATEQDPTALRGLSAPGARGSRDSVAALAVRYPHAFTFISDQELEMLADVAALSRTRARPLWGVEQAAGATHALDYLLTLGLPAGARAVALSLRDSAYAHEHVRDLAKRGLYLGNPAQGPHRTAALRELARAAHPAPGSEAGRVIRSLVMSDSIYRLYLQGSHYENSLVREEYMKERFMDEYRAAQAGGEARPRVVLKFGQWHLFRGLGPNNYQTLGNFASELARSNGMGTLLVAVAGHPGADGAKERAGQERVFAMLGRTAPADAWTVVDLRPLRPHYARLSRDLAPEVNDWFRRYVFGFDALVLVGGIHPATFARTGVAF
jgi:hypothetical protein